MPEIKNETFDYYQELARSSFADMLLDEERNRKYAKGLKEAIERIKSSGKSANVLDIGTGSGLLAMLAARYGADSVVTIEAYSPVSEIARKIITANGLKDKIKMINKHSSEVQVGAGKDMEQKANILVAEVFDTELIGEAAILTYNEAHKNLMETDCICVPHSAEVYVQIVESDLASSWYEFKDICVNERIVLKAPESVNQCQGNGALNDIQLSQFPLKEFKVVTNPLKACEFDFSRKIPEHEKKCIEFVAQEDAKSTTIFFWWDLNMNESGSIKLSCAPHWSHPDTEELSENSKNEIVRQNAIPWRDHWMQACFHIQNKTLKKGEQYQLSAVHDKFSWNFDIFPEKFPRLPMPTCSCSFHRLSKNGILQINDESRRSAFVKFLQKHKNMECALFVGDHSMMSLLAAKMECAGRIFVYQVRFHDFL
jgi:type III protein arginine methyltransferase